MKKTLVFLLIALMSLLCGCETMSGIGKDVEKAGRWVQEKAN